MEAEQIESSVINSTDENLDFWAFVEVMGHSKIAGRLTTRKLGTSVMLQVDVLKPDGTGTAYSKLYSPSALFSVTPVTEEYCRNWAKQASQYDFQPVPFISPPSKQLSSGWHPEDEGGEDES